MKMTKYKLHISKCYEVYITDEEGITIDTQYVYGNKDEATEIGKTMLRYAKLNDENEKE
jgi:hypothetical protein